MAMMSRSVSRASEVLQWVVGCFLVLCAASLSAQGVPFITWPTPAPIPYLTPLSDVQLNATAAAGPTTLVNLAPYYNVTSFSSDGTNVPVGFDNGAGTYSANLVGSSITWKGVTFPIGPANANDSVSQVTFPAIAPSNGGTLLILAAGANDPQPPIYDFILNYTTGGADNYYQGVSDWAFPAGFTPGPEFTEETVKCYPYRNLSGSGQQNTPVCIYGYTLQLEPNQMLASIQLPTNATYTTDANGVQVAPSRDLVVFGAAIIPPAVNGSFSYSPANGTVLPTGANTLNTTFTPTDPGYTTATASVTLNVVAPVPPITPTLNWPTPASIPYGTALTTTQLDATLEEIATPTTIPFTGSAEINAIENDNAAFSSLGFDGYGNAYSANQLGSYLFYNGGYFPLGQPGIQDAITGETLTIPSAPATGNFSSLYLLGAGANVQPNQQFVINYADGSTGTVTQSISSWYQPQNFPGETIVKTTAYADTSTGGSNPGTYDVYGYTIPLDSSRVATSVVLPQNQYVIFLAAGVSNGAGGVTPAGPAIAYNPALGTVPQAGTDTLTATFTPNDTVDFTTATKTVQIVVTPQPITVTANSFTRLYGVANPTFTGSITGNIVNNDVLTETFATTASITSSPGSYPIVPAATGTDVASYTQTVVDGTLTITKAPTTMTLTASSQAPIPGTIDTLTAVVTSSTSGTPTGTVTFFSNGASLGSANVVNGTATLPTTALPLGNDLVTATYNGDVNFLPTSASLGTGAIIVMSYDFTMTAPNGTTISAVWGSAASTLIHIAPVGTLYEGPVTLSIDGGTSIAGGTLITATFTPASVPANAGPIDVTMTIEANKEARNDLPISRGTGPALVSLAALLLLPIARARKLRRRMGGWMAVLLLAVAVVPFVSGCGSGYHKAVLPVTVTATDGTHIHSLSLTLNVMP